MIEAVGLTKAYGGPDIFADVSFDLGRAERLLVLGLNGAGKTTLLRILSGDLSGSRHVPVRPQRDIRLLRPGARQPGVGETLLENIRAEVPPGITLTETELRALLGMFGLSGDKVFQQAGTLSGGRRRSWPWPC